MKLIIAGSRDLSATHDDIANFVSMLEESIGDTVTEVVEGGCRGIDAAGKEWALKSKLPVKTFPADWDANGKAAGPIRNREMANYADALIVIYKEGSKGSLNMKSEMEKLSKPVLSVELEF